MTDRRAWNSNLAAPTKPIARHTRLRNRGGRMFKQSADDKVFFDAKGNGGRDLNNIALLCPTNPFLLRKGCHERQEKKTEKFEAANNVDLHAKARAHTAQWRKETGLIREEQNNERDAWE